MNENHSKSQIKRLFTQGGGLTFGERQQHFRGKHGCDVWASDRTLMCCPLLDNGELEMEGGEPNWHAVSAPDQGFLDDVNTLLNTNFTLSDFPQR